MEQKNTTIPEYGDLTEVVAFRPDGGSRALFFPSGNLSCVSGEFVIAEMEEGQVYGSVVSVLRMNPAHLVQERVSDREENAPGYVMKPLVRKATEKDASLAASNKILAEESMSYCRQCIRERNLDMKLVNLLILHDCGKMVFYFTAPERIDFRELVKDLVRRYHTRIELRQIGVRHETKMVGALGNCGMVCCCRRFLNKFAPVAIKMAKEQNVFLNPIKISGICGRLLCCLAYEQEHYDEFYRSCPKLGKKYHTDAGVLRVFRASLFRESVSAITETGEEVEYRLADWNKLNPFRSGVPQAPEEGGKRDGGGDKQRKNGDTDTVKGWAMDSAEISDVEKIVTVLEDDESDKALDIDADGSIFGLAPRKTQ
ncbi:hypothetical protein FACS1894206_03360 [Deltaproteobacteria bacterium]|nr:hypothetical protein FACS1894206_03360 [Deltaproteobacteria bacterium]